MRSSLQIETIAGAPATGKSTRLLELLRTALKARDWSVRLLVPSATMADHVRHMLAREGYVLRRNTVTTLTGFVDGLRLAEAAPTAAQLEAGIADVIAERCPAEYEAVAGRTGFKRHLASSIEALNLAGVEPRQVDGALGDVYRRVLRWLGERQLALRGDRLKQATTALKRDHLADLRVLLLDGFFTFSNTETALLNRLGKLVDVVATVPTDSPELPQRQPALELLAANDASHEALVIASRVVELIASGVEPRRIGVLLRNPGAYAGLIETTFERCGIASRSYLGTPMLAHPVVEFHREMLEAAAAEWDNALLLRAMRWRFVDVGDGDLLEQRVREALPSQSLELFPQVQPFAAWPFERYAPLAAARELKALAQLIERPRNVSPEFEAGWRIHQREAAITMLHEAMDETAAGWGELTAVTVNEFWRAVEANLAGRTLHERDSRRNVVHVMDLFESRQWDLDYVFAPGLAEGEFPQRFSPDPLLSEAIKRNFGMKTLEERNAEEHFLYRVLLTRASERVVMLYPLLNAKGDPLQPAALITAEKRYAAPVRLGEVVRPLAPAVGQLSRGYRAARAWSASEFEMYLSCPWRHFAARGLELTGLPETPAERLNALLVGEVAHETIRIWTMDPTRDIEQIAERQLERACREKRVPLGYQYERERINLLRNMRIYARYAPPVPAGWQARLEEKFEFVLPPDGPKVRGQIDRYDVAPDGEIHAFDYKYSRAEGLEEKYPVQGALYAKALGERVTQFGFVALRDMARTDMLEGETLRNAIRVADVMMADVLRGVQAGLVPVRPANPDQCQYCEFMDACRIRTVEVEAEEAEEA